MIKLIEFSRDINGNKTIKIKSKNGRSFSIQTLGNLPFTHKQTFDSVGQLELSKINKEINSYVSEHGTKRQKNILGL